jgi:hypothetical protein
MLVASGLANQYYYNYLNQATGLYGQGLQGGQNMYQTGFQGTNELAQSIMNTLMSQGGLGYAGATANRQNIGSSLGAIGGAQGAQGGKLGGTIGTAAGGALGTSFGGPIGGALGSWLGGKLGGMF